MKVGQVVDFSSELFEGKLVTACISNCKMGMQDWKSCL